MIACITVPYFAAEVERRNDPCLVDKPLAIGGQPWEARPVYAFSQEVARQGVQIGMSLRLVQVLSPHSFFMPAAETRYSQVSGELIDLLLDYSPLIEPQELWHPRHDKKPVTIPARMLPARYCLDLEGLPRREAVPFVREIGRSLRKETTFSAAIGVAERKFTAEVAATICRPDHTLPVEAGQDGTFLASRSLKFLPLDNDIARRLRLLGIYSLGQLAALPLTALREQFGPAIIPFYKLARGEGDEPVDAQPAEHLARAEMRFDGPLADLHALGAAAERLLQELAHTLRTSGYVGRTVISVIDREDGEINQQRITLSRPTADTDRLKMAVKEMLAKESFDCAVLRLEITIADLSPARGKQLTLLKSNGHALHRAAIAAESRESLANMIVKYRQSNFFQPRLADVAHPLPERRFSMLPLSYDSLMA